VASSAAPASTACLSVRSQAPVARPIAAMRSVATRTCAFSSIAKASTGISWSTMQARTRKSGSSTRTSPASAAGIVCASLRAKRRTLSKLARVRDPSSASAFATIVIGTS